jgi:hypothetical protein
VSGPRKEFFFFRKEFFFFLIIFLPCFETEIWEESDGVSSTQTAAGSDTAEGTQNTTVLVQMEEEERAIRAMPFVTTLSPVRAVKGKSEGWRVTLTCFACREYNSCGKKQETSVHISGERPNLLACLQELRKRLEEHHGNCAQALTEKDAADAASAATVNPDTPNVLQAMMKLEQAKARAKTANKVALEAEEERDAAETAVEELKRQLLKQQWKN